MPKKTPGHWTMLGASATEETLPSEPYHPSRNWEAIERVQRFFILSLFLFNFFLSFFVFSKQFELHCSRLQTVIQEEENEPLEGQDAVNRMFKKLYSEASDDVKKAMIKSYQESGGTVLSTNWAEISKKRTEVQPPDCMEYKRFEQ
ncbi:unnamed protein product [Nippostrongylus brasiliensis]|uniref:Putative chaperone binding protein (inferred by orthology to a S. mansoni protein) n=1 Tax=Nippostrongylus brasiliensis TaxID=27835 RepID=A0A0N4YLQ1_NIPBR|nr:unnamed protein product [Nippostrongylus brasiliensis]